MSQKQKWEKEYLSDHGVPTTTRTTPSSSVVKGVEFLRQNNFLIGNKVLDLGSGPGRNAIYLAKEGFEITAVDFIVSSLETLKEKTKSEGLQKNIKTVTASIGTKLPFRSDSFDLALDITSSMSLDDDEVVVFEKELRRVLKNKGILIMYVLSDQDEYMVKYGDINKGSYVSPAAGIVEHCRGEKELKQIFKNWEFLKFDLREMEDEYFGKKYTRRLWWVILRNRK
jgi:Methylase involved in ubiquinone/menaquinone biosynthesis